ncbi:MAG: DNA polymerase III subunit delta' [Bosea sp. (in: a-proteobacteria)]
MSTETGIEADRLEGFAHPRETRRLVGHLDAQAAITEGVRTGRLHHAWLVGGPEGIGKATFAYHVAKFLFSLQPSAAPRGDSLVFDPDGRAARLVTGLAHPDLVVLRRQPSTDKKQSTTQIPVETVRRALDVFSTTAGNGGWRVCIVDSAEDLNTAGANALLKVVEEPPQRAIFLIVAHQPGRVLPTIRSRCRKLMLRPLDDINMLDVLGGLGLKPDDRDVRQAVAFADGSVRRALTRLDPETAALIIGTKTLLGNLPDIDIKRVMAMADQLAGRAAEADFAIFVETLEEWASGTLHAGAVRGGRHLAPLAEVWDKMRRSIRETDALNLDRKPLVLSIFHDLADAVTRMRTA